MKTWVSLLLSIALALGLCSCFSEKAPDGDGYSFTDSEGTRVTLTEKPVRVAVLFSSYAEVWQTAGGTVAVTVGDTVERGFAPEGTPLVDAGAGHTAIDRETLVALEPDFVIGTRDFAVQREVCEFMRSVGVPSAVFSVESFEDYLYMLKIFTDIQKTPDRYEKFGTEVGERIEAERERAGGSFAGKTLLFIRAGTSARSVKAKRRDDHFACAMIEELGFYNVANDAPELSDGISEEAVLSADPCYIFVSFMGDEDAARAYVTELFKSGAYKNLSAVKAGRVIFLPKSLFHYKPCSRWDSAYKYIIDSLGGTGA